MLVPKRPTLKRKGRYLLLALALYGLNQWWREPQAEAQLALAQGTAAAESCLEPVSAFAPAPDPPRALTGRLGLWVAKVDPVTLEPLRVVASDPNGVYPLASSYKQAVLWALLKDVDAGTVTLNEKFDVTHANQSLGNYPFDG